MATELNQSRYRITGMDCGACAKKVDTAIRRLKDVQDVAVSATSGMMTVSHAGSLPAETLFRQVRSLGYGVAEIDESDGDGGTIMFPSEGHSCGSVNAG